MATLAGGDPSFTIVSMKSRMEEGNFKAITLSPPLSFPDIDPMSATCVGAGVVYWLS